VSVEISRIAHFSGEGLAAPTEVLRAELGENQAVYFLSPYDKEAQQRVPTVALTVESHEGDPMRRYAFESREARIRPELKAMLTHAALYGASLEVNTADVPEVQLLDGITGTTELLRKAVIYRARYLPAEKL